MVFPLNHLFPWSCRCRSSRREKFFAKNLLQTYDMNSCYGASSFLCCFWSVLFTSIVLLLTTLETEPIFFGFSWSAYYSRGKKNSWGLFSVHYVTCVNFAPKTKPQFPILLKENHLDCVWNYIICLFQLHRLPLQELLQKYYSLFVHNLGHYIVIFRLLCCYKVA